MRVFLPIKAKIRHIILESAVIPFVVKLFRHSGYGTKLFPRVIVDAAGDKTNPLLDFHLALRKKPVKEPDFALVWMDKIEQGFQRRCFARAIAPDKPCNRTGQDLKRHVFQCKAFILLT